MNRREERTMLSFDKMHIRQEDAIYSTSDDKCTRRLYHSPTGALQDNEIYSTGYFEGAFVPYHMYTRGFKTITLETGRAEVTVAGKRCIIESGDMIQIEPYMPYSIRFFDGEGKTRELTQEINQYGNYIEEAYIKSGILSLKNEDIALKELRTGVVLLEEPEPVAAESCEMPMVMQKGRGWVTFFAEGITMTLKVGRWQTHGNKEVWEYNIEKDRVFRFSGRNPDESIYSVCQGKIQVEAAGRVFTAGAGDIICIPPYTPYSMQSTEDCCVIHDYNCKMTLFRLMEELETESSREGADPDAVREKLFLSNKCYFEGSYKR